METRHTFAISGLVSVDALARTIPLCRALDIRLLAPAARGCAAPENDEHLVNDAVGFVTNIVRLSEMPTEAALNAICLSLLRQ